MSRAQRLVPGLIGLAPATDGAYLQAMQAAAGGGVGGGVVNRLRVVVATIDTVAFLHSLATGDDPGALLELERAEAMLVAAGADFVVVTSNTGSALLSQRQHGRPASLDIVETGIETALAVGASRVGLLSTRRTAESGLYQRAAARSGISIVVPSEELAEQVDAVIFGEAVRGIQSPAGAACLRAAAAETIAAGADAVMLGCTDLTLFAPSTITTAVPLIDSARTHASAAAALALSGWPTPGR